MSDVVMPRLSDTMEDGTILRWLKQDGEHVERGEELVEIETDKAAMTYESDREGVLATVANEGDTLAVGELIARIGAADRVADHAGEGTASNGVPATRSPSAPGDAPTEQSARVEEAQQPPTVAASSQPSSGEERIKASPLARRIAGERNVDLQTLVGSGPGGRIVKADVESAQPLSDTAAQSAAGAQSSTAAQPLAATQPVAATPLPAAAQPAAAGSSASSTPSSAPAEEVTSAKGETTIVELSRTQRTIARRMAESKATIPDFTLTTDIDMERCVALRTELKRLSHADAPTYNDMIVKACALALRDYPRANGSYRDGRFELHGRVNVGVAVAVAAGAGDPTDGALVVPTVFDADSKALGEIARETRALAKRVRDGSITPPELSGGTFTVSNLGMYGIKSFTAIVNPPQAAILAVGTLGPRAIVRKKKLVARQTMSVTLACDHRILYGADAALFLARIRELLEEPAALTL
jgi:pyruvate dehydrogenase E2 component (dihydrolipoamide acetyltransferase)